MSESEQKAVNPELYHSMDKKTTEELLAIWNENDREAWTDEAFGAVQAVLLNRLGSIPEQGAFPTDDELTTEQTAILLKTPTLVLLATWSSRFAWAVLAISTIALLLRIAEDMNQSFPNIPEVSFAFAHLAVWVGYVYSLCIGVVYFILLQAVSIGARFLLGWHEANAS